MKQVLFTILVIVLLQLVLFLSLPFILVKDKNLSITDAAVVDVSVPEASMNVKEALKLKNSGKIKELFLLQKKGSNDFKLSIESDAMTDVVYITVPDNRLETKAKSVLKSLLQGNHRSAIIFCEKFDSRRNYMTYTKLHAPVGISIQVAWRPTNWSDLNWPLDEIAIKEVTGNFFKLLLYFIKGYI